MMSAMLNCLLLGVQMLSVHRSDPYPTITIRKSVRSKIVVYHGRKVKLPLCLCGHRMRKEAYEIKRAAPDTVFENSPL